MSETIDAPAPEAAAADESDTLRDVLSRAFDETPEDSGPPRDEQGRFASRQAAEGADAETTSTENVETKAEEPEVPAIVPPQSLSAAEKEAFGNLPREAQEIILRREQENRIPLGADGDRSARLGADQGRSGPLPPAVCRTGPSPRAGYQRVV